MNKTLKFAAAFAVAALVALPSFAQRGSADFTHFVTLGDSYGAGFQSNSLNERHQVWSWPAVVARQAGLTLCPSTAVASDNCFAQPLVSYPGIGPELILQSLTVGPVGQAGQGTPLMTTFGRPYNNLAIPGGTVGALLAITGAEPVTPTDTTPVVFGRFILRGLGTEVQQAVAQHPTFIAMWAGGNDYLGAALAGTPTRLTSTADFKTRYEAVLDQLIAGAPGAGMVVGSLPNQIPPYFTLVPPYLINPATGQPVLGPDGNRIYYVADLGGGNFGQLPVGSYVTLDARAQLGQGYGIPAAFKNIPPFNALPHVGEPLADQYSLTPTETAAIVSRVADYNAIITAAAAQRNIPVADVKGLFDHVYGAGGLKVGPVTISPAFVSGGFFSLDGFHLTDLGYLLMGNEFIKAINSSYETSIPLAGLAQLYANNGAFFPEDSSSNITVGTLTFADGVAEEIRAMWATRAPVRRRGVSH
ncbi:MAG: SGNH/GDSL hydrolase family protein [Acidobacteriota bacterium]